MSRKESTCDGCKHFEWEQDMGSSYPMCMLKGTYEPERCEAFDPSKLYKTTFARSLAIEGDLREMCNITCSDVIDDFDTREKLEADVRKWFPSSLSELHVILGWLDRQAAITEREVKVRELYRFEENHRWHIRSLEDVIVDLNDKISVLRDRVDELTRALATERELVDEIDRR